MVTLQDFAHKRKSENHLCYSIIHSKRGRAVNYYWGITISKKTFGISCNFLIDVLWGDHGGLLYRLVFPQRSVTKPHLEQALAGPDQRYLDVKSAVLAYKLLYCLGIRSTFGSLVWSPLHCDHALPIFRDVSRKQPSQGESRHSEILNFNSDLRKHCLSWRGPRKA